MLPVLYLWDSKAMYIGPSFDTGVHSHNAHQVIVALDGKTKVEIDNYWSEDSIFVIKPNTKHRIHFLGHVALLLIDSEISKLEDSFIPNGLKLESLANLKSCYSQPVSSEDALQLFLDIIQEVGLSNITISKSIDERIVKCLKFINLNLKEELSMETVCKFNGISESSFSHLFSKEVGLPFRRYVLWKRLKESISLYLKDNRTLTEVSQEMGFSDQAHYTKSFKDVFGVKPTFIFRSSLKILYRLKRLRIS